MPFADTTLEKREFKKTKFLALTPGQHFIRILDDNAVKLMTHWVNRSNVICLGDIECPICRDNKRLIAENPQSFRNVKGYNPARRLFLVNVLDKTMVKVCPNCSAENPKSGAAFPSKCGSCEQLLANTQATPSNTVKVLARGVKLFEQFNQIQTSYLDKDGNLIPLNSYDIMLIVTGTGNQTIVAAAPIPESNEPVDVDDSLKYDLTSVIIKLTSDELVDLGKGVSIKDIFAARRALNPEPKDSPEEGMISDIINELIPN